MTVLAESLERHHRPIIAVLALIILALVTSCLFHETIPICHWLFACDHGMHAGAS